RQVMRRLSGHLGNASGVVQSDHLSASGAVGGPGQALPAAARRAAARRHPGIAVGDRAGSGTLDAVVSGRRGGGPDACLSELTGRRTPRSGQRAIRSAGWCSDLAWGNSAPARSNSRPPRVPRAFFRPGLGRLSRTVCGELFQVLPNLLLGQTRQTLLQRQGFEELPLLLR